MKTNIKLTTATKLKEDTNHLISASLTKKHPHRIQEMPNTNNDKPRSPGPFREP
jgi:hypothetical protein